MTRAPRSLLLVVSNGDEMMKKLWNLLCMSERSTSDGPRAGRLLTDFSPHIRMQTRWRS
jgi:hypothetical protein